MGVPAGIFRKLTKSYTNKDMNESKKRQVKANIREAYTALHNHAGYDDLKEADDIAITNGVKLILDTPDITPTRIEKYATEGFPNRNKPSKSATKTLKSSVLTGGRRGSRRRGSRRRGSRRRGSSKRNNTRKQKR